MSAKRVLIHTFPGFLGSAEDWHFLKNGVLLWDYELHWNFSLVHPELNETWSTWCDRWLIENPIVSGSFEKEIVLGYSLGGRAAMQLALRAPHRFSGLMAISSHPGLISEADREARMANDHAWASRFEKDSWHELLESWNSQPAFQGISLPERLIARHNARDQQGNSILRERSVRQLRQLSLANQRNLRPELSNFPGRQTWLVGALDDRYVQHAREMASLGRNAVHTRTIADAGHRWPWEISEAQAAEVISQALQFLLQDHMHLENPS
jgi:2-succinyl-6-hydroxy-2,4-cyclohexadiene-1-carboxylate synthase